MKPEIKAQWIAALRSGEYEQGRGSLRTIYDSWSEYCCLGVLCDLHAKATGTNWDGEVYLNEGAVLPATVIKWAKLDDEAAPEGYLLIEHNDGLQDEDGSSLAPKDFNQIADLIEKHL